MVNKPLIRPYFLGGGSFGGWETSNLKNDGNPEISWGPINPNRDWVDEFIPYYMEIMGV